MKFIPLTTIIMSAMMAGLATAQYTIEDGPIAQTTMDDIIGHPCKLAGEYFCSSACLGCADLRPCTDGCSQATWSAERSTISITAMTFYLFVESPTKSPPFTNVTVTNAVSCQVL